MNFIRYAVILVFSHAAWAQSPAPAATAKSKLSMELIQVSELKQLLDSYVLMSRSAINRKKNEPACVKSADCTAKMMDLEKEFEEGRDASLAELTKKMQDQLESKFTDRELSTLIKFNKHSLIHRFKDYMSGKESSDPMLQKVEETKSRIKTLTGG